MTEPDDSPAPVAMSGLSRKRLRLFWAATTLGILAILVVCAALITIAATRS